MQNKWSLSQIKYAHESVGGFFFSPDTMKFFKDTMKTLKVLNCEDGVFVYRSTSPFNIWQFNTATKRFFTVDPLLVGKLRRTHGI